ncbi:cell division protein FtsZ, partial [Paracoccus sp. PXZ]
VQGRMGGLSRMLERISGHGEQAEKPAPSTIAERVNERVAARNRSGFDAGFDDLASPDRAGDNVEIPAFLRRQAN